MGQDPCLKPQAVEVQQWTCGEIAVAGCENNSRRAEDVVKQHNSIEMCDAITDQQIPDAILCHF